MNDFLLALYTDNNGTVVTLAANTLKYRRTNPAIFLLWRLLDAMEVRCAAKEEFRLAVMGKAAKIAIAETQQAAQDVRLHLEADSPQLADDNSAFGLFQYNGLYRELIPCLFHYIWALLTAWNKYKRAVLKDAKWGQLATAEQVRNLPYVLC